MTMQGKRCHHCELLLGSDSFYISISVQHTSKSMHNVELAFHTDCFMEIAGEEYAQELGKKIEKYTENLQKAYAINMGNTGKSINEMYEHRAQRQSFWEMGGMKK